MGLPIVGRSKAMDDMAKKFAASAVSTTVTITELTGEKRKIEVTARCLPFAPVEHGLTQRHRKVTYPGATEATLQVFGPDVPDLRLNGRWATRYMDQERLFLLTVKGAVEHVRHAERARVVFTDVCRQGQQVEVAWGSGDYDVVLRGLVARVGFTEQAPQSIGWELILVSVADSRYTQRPPVAVKQAPKTKSLYQDVEGLINEINNVVKDLNAAYREYVLGTLGKVNKVLGQLGDLAKAGIGIAALPAQAARSALVVVGNVRQTLVDVENEVMGLVCQYEAVAADARQVFTSRMAWTGLGSGISHADDSAMAARRELAMMNLLRQVRAVRYGVDQYSRQMATYLMPAYRGIHFVKAGETLRSVATLHYGRADQWIQIADANALRSDELHVGMVLLLPEVA